VIVGRLLGRDILRRRRHRQASHWDLDARAVGSGGTGMYRFGFGRGILVEEALFVAWRGLMWIEVAQVHMDADVERRTSSSTLHHQHDTSISTARYHTPLTTPYTWETQKSNLILLLPCVASTRPFHIPAHQSNHAGPNLFLYSRQKRQHRLQDYQHTVLHW
jgi:hypothetical protein